MTIPSIAPPPRAGEPAGNSTADGEGGAGFADALQRAQGEPKPAHGSAPRAQAPKPADARTHAHATRHARAEGQGPASEDTTQPGGGVAGSDAATVATGESAAGDAAPRSDTIAQGDPTLPLPPAIAIEAPVAAHAAVEASRSEPLCGADAGTDDPVPAVDDRTVPSRAGSRSGGAHDLRAAPSLPGRATPANEPAGARDGAAARPLPHPAIDATAPDGAAAPSAALRAPSLERPAAEPSATPLAATLFTRELGAAAAPGSEPKAAQATLQAAVDEPGFGAALGTQVALWVRDGVQEARLQLHPAELGPVTVQIALEGQAAHVDFTAAVAATRESIEQSLPALAAALRESGFTLTGGGVSSHAGQGGAGDGRRERAQAGPGNRSRGDAGADASHATGAPRRWARSLVDVYA